MDSPDFLTEILEFICGAINYRNSTTFRGAFRSAGAESFLVDPQLVSRLSKLGEDRDYIRKQVKESLTSLRAGR